MLGAGGAPRQREIAEEVVVVAELLRLGCGPLLDRVERRRSGQHRIAPADQHLRCIARRYLHVLGDMVCARLGKPKLDAASATRLVSVPPSAPSAVEVTKPFSTARRLNRAPAISTSGRLLEWSEPMSTRR